MTVDGSWRHKDDKCCFQNKKTSNIHPFWIFFVTFFFRSSLDDFVFVVFHVRGSIALEFVNGLEEVGLYKKIFKNMYKGFQKDMHWMWRETETWYLYTAGNRKMSDYIWILLPYVPHGGGKMMTKKQMIFYCVIKCGGGKQVKNQQKRQTEWEHFGNSCEFIVSLRIDCIENISNIYMNIIKHPDPRPDKWGNSCNPSLLYLFFI